MAIGRENKRAGMVLHFVIPFNVCPHKSREQRTTLESGLSSGVISSLIMINHHPWEGSRIVGDLIHYFEQKQAKTDVFVHRQKGQQDVISRYDSRLQSFLCKLQKPQKVQNWFTYSWNTYVYIPVYIQTPYRETLLQCGKVLCEIEFAGWCGKSVQETDICSSDRMCTSSHILLLKRSFYSYNKIVWGCTW